MLNLFEKFERQNENLISRRKFAKRIFVFAFMGIIIETLTIFIGSLGFHFIEGLSWLNSILNATMVITGNGPSFEAHSNTGKIFQIIFSVAGVIIFVLVISVILVPVFHRVLHSFHFDVSDYKTKSRNIKS